MLGLGMLALFVLFGGAAFAMQTAQSNDNIPVVEPTTGSSDPWTRFDDLYKKYADNFGIEWQCVKAFALNESSNGQAGSVAWGIDHPEDVDGSKSEDGKSWGIMQMTLPTAREIDPSVTPAKLNDPEYSIRLACDYISELENMYDPTDSRFKEWVVKSYNQGPGNTRKEIAGTGGGYANEYWKRWQRNYNKVIGG